MLGTRHTQGAAHVSPSCSGSSSPVLEPLPPASATGSLVTALPWPGCSSSLLGWERMGFCAVPRGPAAASAVASPLPSAVTSGCWASAGPAPSLARQPGLFGCQGWHLAGHQRREHQWGPRPPVAPSLGTHVRQQGTAPVRPPPVCVLTKSCLGMTAMLTLRRADPCNGGAGGEHRDSRLPVLPISFPIASPAQARDTEEEKGCCQPPTGPGAKGEARQLVR